MPDVTLHTFTETSSSWVFAVGLTISTPIEPVSDPRGSPRAPYKRQPQGCAQRSDSVGIHGLSKGRHLSEGAWHPPCCSAFQQSSRVELQDLGLTLHWASSTGCRMQLLGLQLPEVGKSSRERQAILLTLPNPGSSFPKLTERVASGHSWQPPELRVSTFWFPHPETFS